MIIPQNSDIYINKEKLKRVNSCKYLEVNFDCNLKWDEHQKLPNQKNKLPKFRLLQN